MNIVEPAVLTPCLVGLGAILKRDPRVPDWRIPEFICLAGALVMTGLAFAPEATGYWLHYTIQGLMSGLSATGLHQIGVQRTDGKKEWETRVFMRDCSGPATEPMRREQPPLGTFGDPPSTPKDQP